MNDKQNSQDFYEDCPEPIETSKPWLKHQMNVFDDA